MRAVRAIVCLGVLLSGCSIADLTVRKLGRAGTQGAVLGLSDSRAEVRAALRDMLLQDDLLQRIAERFTRGAIGGMTEDAQKARVAALVAAMTDALKERGSDVMQAYLRTAGAELERTLEHVATDALGRMDAAVKGLINEDLTAATQRLLKANAETLARVLAAELEGALGRSLQQASGQVARTVVREAVAELRTDESRAAVRELLREATRDAVSGARQGLADELAGSRTYAALIAGLIAMGSILLLSALALGFFIRHYVQSTKALALIAQKINEVPESATIKEAIRSGAQKNRVDGWLSSFLRRRGL
jgi:hypothetical protein